MLIRKNFKQISTMSDMIWLLLCLDKAQRGRREEGKKKGGREGGWRRRKGGNRGCRKERTEKGEKR